MGSVSVELGYPCDGGRERFSSHTLNVQTKSGNILNAPLISERTSSLTWIDIDCLCTRYKNFIVALKYSIESN